MGSWSVWRAFPDPRKGEMLVAPAGPGVYELRNKTTGELVLVGESVTCGKRMRSLLPPPLGTGTRNNMRKREYVLAHLKDIEYRTMACQSKADAKSEQDTFLATQRYIFHT